jgi:hypothetical protein
MTDMKHIIEPERMGLWVAATFILALLALAVAVIGIQRNKQVAYISQTEVLMLNKKIDALNKGQTPPAAAPQSAPEEKK